MNTRARFDIRAAVQDEVATAPSTIRALLEPPRPPLLAETQAPAAPAPTKQPKVSSREGAKGVTVFLQPEVWKKLKWIALCQGKTTQDLVAGCLGEFCERQAEHPEIIRSHP